VPRRASGPGRQRPGAWCAVVMAAGAGTGTAPSATFDLPLRVSARADYAVRALTELAASGGGPITAQRISRAQSIPLRFLLNILAELRRAGLVQSHRGPLAGYELTRPPEDITLEETIQAVEGDLSRMHGTSLERVTYPGAAEPLRDVWLAVRSSLSAVLAAVTLADVATGSLPREIQVLAVRPRPGSGDDPP
jgi:Rrf2 family protein